MLGVQASGQGHETVFGRLVAEQLGISADYVTVSEGDTRQAFLPGGTSTASRSTTAAGATIVHAVETLINKEHRRRRKSWKLPSTMSNTAKGSSL